MEFYGRQNLASNFLEYFENYENTFLDNIKNIKQKIEKKEILIYEFIIKSFLLKDFNKERFEQECEKLEISEFTPDVLSYGLLRLNIDFMQYLVKNNYDLQNATFLSNALNELIKITYIKKEETQKIDQQTFIETFKIQTSSNNSFFLRENFIDSFKKMFNTNTPLEFLNLYKGVPVRSKGEILSIDDDTITAKVDTMQILAMQDEKNAYLIANDYIDKNLSASLLLPNPIAKTVSLNNFKIQENMNAIKRKYPRVHPSRFTRVLLTNKNNKTVNGKLFDISEGGIGVVSSEDNGFQNGEEINAKLELIIPNTQEKVSLDLNFKLIVLIRYLGAFRYCLELLPNQENIDIIADFSKQRVDETLQELSDILKNYENY